jgi:DNA repair protein RecO (recombination protein O)
MSLEKSEALVLKTIPFRDTSKIVTLYTAEHGLVSVLGKGVRGVKPRFGSALEIFAHIDVVYYSKPARDLQLLSQAALLDPFLGLAEDMERYAHGCAVLEFLLKALTGQEPPGRVYPLSLRALEVMETCPREGLSAVFRTFTLKAVSFLGHRPELYLCVECGAEVSPPIGFAPFQGGVVCPRCASRVAGAFPIGVDAVHALQFYLQSRLREVAEAPPAIEAQREAAGALDAFLRFQMERYESLRSLRLAALPSALIRPQVVGSTGTDSRT